MHGIYPPFVDSDQPRTIDVDMFSEPASRRRLRIDSRESAVPPTGACVELEREQVQLDDGNREDAEHGVVSTGKHGN